MKITKVIEATEKVGEYTCITTKMRIEENKNIIHALLLPVIKLLNKILTHVNTWLEKKVLNGR